MSRLDFWFLIMPKDPGPFFLFFRKDFIKIAY